MQAEDRVTMPLSGRTFVWRSDGTWLDVDPVYPDDAESWHVWPEDTDTVSSAGETAPGNSALPTWWLCWGEAPAEIPVVAWRGDNADVAVVRLGGLWIAEWWSIPMTLFVSIGGEVSELSQIRPGYLGPEAHPYQFRWPNPRAERGDPH